MEYEAATPTTHHPTDGDPMHTRSSTHRISLSMRGGGDDNGMSYLASELRDDTWSCVIVLLTFWLFASLTLILGFYGSVNMVLGPNCSRLLQPDSIFVQDIKVKGVYDSGTGPMLYGFSSAPPLDVEVAWSETHNETLPADSHKEWIYYLNEGATLDIHYSVSSHDPFPLALVIAQGKESLVEWTEDPSYPNITLSWNIIHGNGVIRQKITTPSDYYIGVGNLNQSSVKDDEGDDGYVKISYGPRWITYFVGSGAVTLAILLACKVFIKYQSGGETNLQMGDNFAGRAPLLTSKDDDETSWSSSYDSTSHEDPEEQIAEEAGICPICRKKMKKVKKIFTV
ncbi:hypothetical protein QJS10_CPB19g02028 [Acorus calamus]|uniref:E3 ubiquitin-protein ligase APD1-4 N-terminal domain-containing protein n=1 Tax=Acorus calamus TaxID=4465 RepID=A0AAV9CKI6_ACOCL|nr:hypothetical protein QJS10_CPB19g02028 [Acorus calamus]